MTTTTKPPRRGWRGRLPGLLGLAALGTSAALLAAQPWRASADPDRTANIEPEPRVAGGGSTPQIAHEAYKLDNGLEVLLIPDRSVPLVAVDVWYHVGSGYEVPGKSGFAHLFEHMLFQGSKNVGEDKHFAILKEAGASEVNGTTNSDRTNYYEVLPSNQLELALWLESDRMAHLLPMLTEKSLANQRDVVRNERRQRYDNAAYGATRFAIAHALYPEGHPYRDMTIGKHEDLERASVDDVKQFFQTWYVPANATLAIAGDFDVATAKAAVAKWFGTMPTSTKPVPVRVPAPRPKAARIELTDAFAKLPQLQLAWHSPASFAPGDAELDLAADALTREGTGRLYRILVHERQLAQSVVAYQGSAGFSSTFNIVVTLRTDADAKLVEQIVRDEVQKLATEPLSARERDRAVTNIEADFVRGLEGLLARAERLQTYNHFLGDPAAIGRDMDRYRSATVEQVRQTVASTLVLDQAVVALTTPAPAAAASKGAN